MGIIDTDKRERIEKYAEKPRNTKNAGLRGCGPWHAPLRDLGFYREPRASGLWAAAELDSKREGRPQWVLRSLPYLLFQ